MSSFRKNYTIKRKAQGSYVKGIWTPGAVTEVTIKASFQPVGSDDISALAIGRKDIGKIKGYSDTLLNITDITAGTTGDIVVYNGKEYEVIYLDKNRSDVINHYKYIAEYREVTEVTNDD